MKNVIYTYYNIMLYDINRDKNNYYFYYNNESYLFYLVENEEEVVRFVYNFFKNNNLDCYEIIRNKDNNLFTLVDNKKYSLLKLNGILKYEIKFEDLRYYPVEKSAHNWGNLWSDRLDYYEIQIRELGYNYQTVLNSFGLFSGMAENAILYFNLTKSMFNEDELVGIVHNRMKYPCYEIDYNNPLNFVIDYNVRDIAEYIKSYILYDDYDVNNVLILLDRLNINKLMFNLLYSRLLYPTFYFDVFDKIILEDGVDNDIIPIVEKTEVYLDTLKSIYYKFKDKYDMFNVEWLNKNVEN
ncbi:MAG: hypothetical protein IJD92_04375 [Bacilli bacterium]|nr:hypothetical protein [Bacilli bacterium]